MSAERARNPSKEQAPSMLGTKLDHIREQIGVSFREVAELIDTTPETVSRWRQGRVDPQPAKLKRLATLVWLAEELAEFYEPAEARLWLFTPQRLLGDVSPADRIAEDRTDEVYALIKQLRDGAFV